MTYLDAAHHGVSWGLSGGTESSPPPGSEGQEEMAFEGSTSWGLHRGREGPAGSWGAGRSPLEEGGEEGEEGGEGGGRKEKASPP